MLPPSTTTRANRAEIDAPATATNATATAHGVAPRSTAARRLGSGRPAETAR